LAQLKILAWRPCARPELVLRGPFRGGEGEGKGSRGEERKGKRGAGRRKMGGDESWNRAADWLRPALMT